ncbi:hypothetical protein QO058_00300 [Bosea vestrisii]|uniref:hypothetical protein n=1 Tax=Bosea vestrisii TaxID=151416 RepID=UPI0024DFFB43|nr:hypothetical protein [Bosea vestrisii]WID96776.1 hypothetical protein QO058_00300 [Bosea vestrisii]
MRRSRLPALLLVLLACASSTVQAQDTRDLGLPPASGFQNPVLPPPSGSQNPVLPPQSGQRYMPGIDGPFGEGARRPARPPQTPGVDNGVSGTVNPETIGLGGEAIDRLDQIGPALRRCWQPPALDAQSGSASASVRFSLRRDGSLFGQPRVTWEMRRAPAGLRERFSDSLMRAVRDCTPMRLSPGLGGSIAGRPITIRFFGRVPTNERSV